MIDMTKCKKGDKLRLRDGGIVTFHHATSTETNPPRYIIVYPSGSYGDRNRDGSYIIGANSCNDIVEVLS